MSFFACSRMIIFRAFEPGISIKSHLFMRNGSTMGGWNWNDGFSFLFGWNKKWLTVHSTRLARATIKSRSLYCRILFMIQSLLKRHARLHKSQGIGNTVGFFVNMNYREERIMQEIIEDNRTRGRAKKNLVNGIWIRIHHGDLDSSHWTVYIRKIIRFIEIILPRLLKCVKTNYDLSL